MKIGVPKEIKNHEYRVGLTPESVREVVRHGHAVVMQSGAGLGIGCADELYRAAGAEIAATAEEVFASAGMIVKVKEPQAVERALLRPGHLLFTYLHLAPDPVQTRELVGSGAVCVAYETITDAQGRLPLLAPMSQVAGRMAIQAGATALEKAHGGRGILLGGVPGVAPGKVVVLGGGVAGENAIEMAIGLGAQVSVLDTNQDVLERLAKRFGGSLRTLKSNVALLEREVIDADLVIGAVLIKGAAAPKLVSRDLVGRMRPGSVLVDIAIDQGGCFETSRATTHAEPTYIEQGVVHYCVANMPGAVAHTSTYALNNATLPYVLQLADQGYRQALRSSPGFLSGLNVCRGHVTEPSVARDLGLEFVPPEAALAA